MYYIDKTENLTLEKVEKYIEDYKYRYLPRLLKNKRYYDCKNDAIMNRTFTDITKPNNQIATPWAKYISTLISGYFMGKPITYDTQQEELKNIIAGFAVKEIAHNQSIERDVSIFGIGAELVFVNENKEVQFEKLEPTTVIPIYSTDITKELLYCIRFWDTKDILSNETTTFIEVYSADDIKYYKKSVNGTVLTGTEDNYFKQVPINIFYNNEDITGDAEPVLKLIDGYDLALSDTANFREELNDSYLCFRNANLDTEDIITMKQNRIISIEDSQEGMQSSVSWLNKDSNDVENENYKNRLADDIKRFSFVADIETAKSHTTATSAKIGLMGIEQICAGKEVYFRQALLRRLNLICRYYNLLGSNINTNDVKISFVRNIPVDLSVIGDTVAKLAPFVSKRTLLAQIPFINNIDGELKQIKEENNLDAYAPEGEADDE
ncbi:MAG: phage portal protein [Clostridia bacterium]|nr:phage portal protein [Clostridia bacterium]MCI2014557.1 phage portal protein [Clostridia bacterium]